MRYQIVDGAHRFFAARDIVNSQGHDYFNNLIDPDSITPGLACQVLRYDTPEQVCIGWAAKLNNTNENYTKMTYVDRLSFFLASANACAKMLEKKVGWVEFAATEFFKHMVAMEGDASKPSGSQQDTEKMMAILKGIVSKKDNDAIIADSLAYRKPDTHASISMQMLLFEGLRARLEFRQE